MKPQKKTQTLVWVLLKLWELLNPHIFFKKCIN